jgi:hypothetical protein
VALVPALYLIYQATVENTYLSTLVRIQTDRNQHVISTGVYGFVRHPLYLGCLLMILGAPLLLGSLYGFSAWFSQWSPEFGLAGSHPLPCRAVHVGSQYNTPSMSLHTFGDSIQLSHKLPHHQTGRRTHILPEKWYCHLRALML